MTSHDAPVGDPARTGRPLARLSLYLRLVLLLDVLFVVVYGGLNWLTARRADTHALYFEWERQAPFVPGMIVAYFSIVVLFFLPLFLLDERAMRLLARRIALAIVPSGCGLEPAALAGQVVVEEFGAGAVAAVVSQVADALEAEARGKKGRRETAEGIVDGAVAVEEPVHRFVQQREDGVADEREGERGAERERPTAARGRHQQPGRQGIGAKRQGQVEPLGRHDTRRCAHVSAAAARRLRPPRHSLKGGSSRPAGTLSPARTRHPGPIPASAPTM
jgi:hypothetical protein